MRNVNGPPRPSRIYVGAISRLDRRSGEATTSAHAALILDLKRRYLEMRPRLRRIYSLAADPAAALSQFAPLGFARLPNGVVEIGGTEYHALYNDFGPSSIDGWLTDVAGRKMLNDDAPPCSIPTAASSSSAASAPISPSWNSMSFNTCTNTRAGSSAGRRCCATVWGYDWSGGSNVVEVVISALRRKLGDSAGSLRTVRGPATASPLRSDPRSGTGSQGVRSDPCALFCRRLSVPAVVIRREIVEKAAGAG
ncbi:MAG: winged helix-turn-helix domain-containing protein [Jatrophihabitans sp.]